MRNDHNRAKFDALVLFCVIILGFILFTTGVK